MSTIAAGTSVGTALVSTGDTTGALVLQTNGTTTAVTIATNQVVTLAQPLPVGSGGTGATSLSGLTVGTATTATNLAGGSNGTIPYQSAAGTTQMLAVGTSGQVLQTNGAGAPTWVTPSGGGAVTIASGSFPAASTLNITNIPATYGQLVLVIEGISCSATGRFINIRVSTDNGSSYDTTAGNYLGNVLNGSSPTTSSRATLVEGNSLGSTEFASGDVSIFAYQGGMYPQYMGRFSNSIGDKQFTIGTYMGSTSAINALQISWSNSGDFDAGTYVLKGIT